MPYGQAGRLGDRIDPRLMQVDFSPIERAGAAQGQAFANVGADIGEAIKIRAKEKKDINKQIDFNTQFLTQLAEVAPQYKDQIGEALNMMTDPSTSPAQAAAYGQASISALQQAIDMGVKQQQLDMQREGLELRRQAAQAGGGGAVVMTPEQFKMEQEAGGKLKGMRMPDGNYMVESATYGGGPLVNIQNAPKLETGYRPIKDADGNIIGAEPIPGSNAELQEKLKRVELEQKMGEVEDFESKGRASKAKENEGRKNFTEFASTMLGSYADLAESGGAIMTDQTTPENIKAYLGSTKLGQGMGSAIGSQNQVYRAKINAMMPNMINVIRQSTEMGARGMDTDAERKFYMSAAGDPLMPLEANLKAIDTLDKQYGTGKALDLMLKDNPALKKRVKEYQLDFKPTESANDSPWDSDTQSLIEKYSGK